MIKISFQFTEHLRSQFGAKANVITTNVKGKPNIDDADLIRFG